MKFQKPQKNGNRWRIRVDNQWLSFNTEAEAENEAKRIKLGKEQERLADASSGVSANAASLAGVAEMYKRGLEAQGCKPNYLKKVSRYLRMLQEKAKSAERASDITPVVLNDVLLTFDAKAQNDKRYFIRTVKSFLKWCKTTAGVKIHENTLSYKLPKVDRKEQRLLTDEEMRKILAHAKKTETAGSVLMLEFMATFGLRPFEFCALKLENLNEAQGSITVMGKTRSERVIYIPEELQKRILDRFGRFKKTTDSPLFFHGDDPQTTPWNWTYLRDVLKRVAAGAGVVGHVKPYLLRHYAATNIFKKTGDMKMVTNILGHGYEISQNIYQHREPDDMRKLALVVSESLSKKK